MNSQHTFNDLLDLLVKDKVTMEELALLSGNNNMEELHFEASRHRTAVISIQRVAIAQQVASVHRKYIGSLATPASEPKIIPIYRNKKIIRIAAAAAVFFGLFISMDRLLVNPDMIYKESYQEYFVNTERSVGSVEQSNLTDYFRSGNSQAVIEAFGSIQNPGSKEKFLAGYSYMKSDNYKQAKDLFKAVIQGGNETNEFLFKDEAEYYLTLTYLKLKEFDEAYSLMKSIRSNPEHTYSDAFDSWTLLRTKWLD
jgi:tetratricopeptide (TPR) repeat protein